MSTTTHSDLRDMATPRPPAASRPDSNSTTPEPPVHDDPLNSFMYGLKSIFESLVTQPDFSRYYERNSHRRLLASWARVGHSMQHALGKPVTFSFMSPDGRRMTRVVAPDTSDEQYQAALRRAREAAPDLDAGASSDHVVIHVTGKQAADLMAQAGGAVRYGAGR